MKIIRNILLSGLVALFLLSSCKKHEFVNPGTTAVGAKLAFVHASEKSGGIDFWMSGKKISSATLTGSTNARSTRFPQSGYSVFSSGSFDISTYIQGKVKIDSIQTSTVPAFALQADKYYTYFYYDKADGTQTAKVLEETIGATESNKASVKFVNLVTNAASVKLVVTSSNELPAPTLPYILDNSTTFENIGATPYSYSFSGLTVSYTFTYEVWNTEVTPNVKLASLASEVVSVGRAYTVVAYGSAKGTVRLFKFLNKAY